MLAFATTEPLLPTDRAWYRTDVQAVRSSKNDEVLYVGSYGPLLQGGIAGNSTL
jgi:hypothetical protein